MSKKDRGKSALQFAKLKGDPREIQVKRPSMMPLQNKAVQAHSATFFKSERTGDVGVFGSDVIMNKKTTRNFAKVGRNQQCPCNSGMKYKNCHGRPAVYDPQSVPAPKVSILRDGKEIPCEVDQTKGEIRPKDEVLEGDGTSPPRGIIEAPTNA